MKALSAVDEVANEVKIGSDESTMVSVLKKSNGDLSFLNTALCSAIFAEDYLSKVHCSTQEVSNRKMPLELIKLLSNVPSPT